MDWDRYWTDASTTRQQGLYARLAEFYRVHIISPAAASVLRRYLPDAPGHHYLHAGCGSGGSDQRWRLEHAVVHALDISLVGLQLNRARRLPFRQWHVCGDLLRLPYGARTMDGIFNFGVMEHFDQAQLQHIFSEFRRVLKPDGRVVLFWAPEFGLAVNALRVFVGVANRFRTVPLTLHPDEISRVQSFGWVRSLLVRYQFHTERVLFDWRDVFTNAIVIARPVSADDLPLSELARSASWQHAVL